MARRAAASTLMRRLVSSSLPRPFWCPARWCCGEVDLSKPPYNMISYLGDWHLTEKAMKHPGMDYEHWFVQVYKPGFTKDQLIQYFIRSLYKVLPREVEAEKRIYKYVFKAENSGLSGFGCEIDWATKDKLEGLPGIAMVSPDYYPDPNIEDYGGELVVNGSIVPRSEEDRPICEISKIMARCSEVRRRLPNMRD